MMFATLQQLETRIAGLRAPADLFDGDIDGNLRKLLALCHPDRNPGSDLAARLFLRVQELADEARQPTVIVKSPKRQYELYHRRWVGDVADIHLATAEGNPYLVKISRVPGAERLLDRERQVLTELHTAAADAKYRCYFPLLAESFPARGRFKRRVNVFTHEEGWYSLEEVKRAFPSGLHGRHIVWIMKRLLTAIGFADRQKIVHGAILPCHVLVRPRDHALRLIGWGQSVMTGKPLKSIATRFKDQYPPEVFAKKPARSGADVAMGAALMVGLCDKEHMPMKLLTFLNGCQIAGQWSRDEEPWDLVDELDELASFLYGPPKFYPLAM